MGFFNVIFKSQIPEIVKRLQVVRTDLRITQKSIENLMLLEKFSRENLSSNEKILEQSFNSMDIPLWIKDLNSKFIFVNDACCGKILKCTREKAIGLSDGELKKDVLAQVCMRSDRKIIKNSKTMRFIEHAVKKDGSHIYIDTVKSPVFDDKRELIAIAGNAIDITDNVPELIRQNKANGIEIPLEIVLSSDNLSKILGGNIVGSSSGVEKI